MKCLNIYLAIHPITLSTNRPPEDNVEFFPQKVTLILAVKENECTLSFLLYIILMANILKYSRPVHFSRDRARNLEKGPGSGWNFCEGPRLELGSRSIFKAQDQPGIDFSGLDPSLF